MLYLSSPILPGRRRGGGPLDDLALFGPLTPVVISDQLMFNYCNNEHFTYPDHMELILLH